MDLLVTPPFSSDEEPKTTASLLLVRVLPRVEEQPLCSRLQLFHPTSTQLQSGSGCSLFFHCIPINRLTLRTVVRKDQPRFLLFSCLASLTGCRSKRPGLTPWLPAVVQHRGNNIHSSNAGLIQAVSCFFRSV